MNRKINWLHLSDFHFGKSLYEQKFSAQKLIEHIEQKKSAGIFPDFVFITGDIANSGRLDEYDLFNSLIVKKLLEIFGNEFIDRIITVPGNHDLDREINPGFSKEKFLRDDAGAFYPTVESLRKRKMLADRFENYIFGVGNDNLVNFGSEVGGYVQEFLIDDVEISVVGINTAWLCDGEGDFGNITPGLQILRDNLAKTKNSSIKIVLGHHPLSWFHERVIQPIEVIFGEHNVIYLHGHMHKSWAKPALSATGDFICIQSGAAWQAPEGSKWKNGFLWAELSDDRKNIDLEPFTWSFSNQCWTLSGETFHENNRIGGIWRFLAPTNKIKVDYTPRKRVDPPTGWIVKSLDELEKCRIFLDKDQALRYFDGAAPTWNTVLSESIPRRDIVSKITNNFSSISADPIVSAVVGAGCEGKTTALFQACLEILQIDQEKKALIRTNHVRPFSVIDLLPILKTHHSWLMVIDEADQSAKEILRFIDNGFDGYDGQISFILASRDSDWFSSGASVLAWDYTAKYKEIILKDLSTRDAEFIVDAWAAYGEDGLGAELSALDETKRVDKLKYYAKKEAKGNYGAFFGALLVARHGNDLLDHAEKMLARLEGHNLNDDQSLMDALGYIAAMHSEGFDKLSFATLAGVLNLPISKMVAKVIRPLGREAAAATTANFIFTRHKYIADAIVEVLESRFNKDVARYFIELALSEQRRSETEQVLNKNFWFFELSEGLFKSGKTGLAIDVARNLYENEEGNFHLLTKLASLYRRENNAAESIRLFRESSYYPAHRGFYFEWGVCEGKERNFSENALLIAYAMSDDIEKTAISLESCCKMLNALSQCYNQLYNRYVDPIFEQASHAASSLLSIFETKIPIKERSGYNTTDFLKLVGRKRATLFKSNDAIKKIKDATSRLKNYGISDNVLSSLNMSFEDYSGVERLAQNIQG
ncbi:metallophosphoesterase [Janthinobacterium sp. YR213]|uniref:metallophosphoesterase family protein n=1 Tax=Janthinobacterium sp. YR213 TaxID=1881027 RepID=UPI000880965C|nr:metallophosphoesterase [Janthinobacterium sp. YR213]SDG76968.1 3',5'-cyclic AMP phosphodiesterase CpdA [Janthinobacterium sp. YR213]